MVVDIKNMMGLFLSRLSFLSIKKGKVDMLIRGQTHIKALIHVQ